MPDSNYPPDSNYSPDPNYSPDSNYSRDFSYSPDSNSFRRSQRPPVAPAQGTVHTDP